MPRKMMSVNVLAVVAVLFAVAVSLGPVVFAQQEGVVAANASSSKTEESTLRFAVLTDTSVFETSVAAEVQTACTITDSYEAVEDPEQRCHVEALQMCIAMGDDCGGYVIEPAAMMIDSETEDGRVTFEKDVTGIKVKILVQGASQDMQNLLTVPGATLYEKRQLVADPELLAELYDEQKLAERAEKALEMNAEIQEMEDELERRVAVMNNDKGASASGEAAAKYAEMTDREIAVMVAQLKEVVITDVFQKALERKAILEKSRKRINIPIPDIPYPTFPYPDLPEKVVPIVTCTPGSFTGSGGIFGRTAYAQFTPYIKPIFTPKRCTLAQFTPTLCACTAAVYTPKTCTGGLFLPGRKGRIIPPIKTPARFEPPTCDVEYIEVHPGGFTHSP